MTLTLALLMILIVLVSLALGAVAPSRLGLACVGLILIVPPIVVGLALSWALGAVALVLVAACVFVIWGSDQGWNAKAVELSTWTWSGGRVMAEGLVGIAFAIALVAGGLALSTKGGGHRSFGSSGSEIVAAVVAAGILAVGAYMVSREDRAEIAFRDRLEVGRKKKARQESRRSARQQARDARRRAPDARGGTP